MGTDNQVDGAGGERPESLAEVLASIRALVSAETDARMVEAPVTEEVLMLTAEMRVAAPARTGEILAEGIGALPARPVAGAPILDEEALRGVINSIVREELQGELGERISRNLHKLVRREIDHIRDEDGRKS